MSSITIIDDDPKLAEDLSYMLKKVGYSVNVLDQTTGAIAELSNHKPDLLILDIMFPESPCAGFDLARQIRLTPVVRNLPIIMLTGLNKEYSMDFSARDIDDDWMPIQDFVEKPVNFFVLVEKIKEMLS